MSSKPTCLIVTSGALHGVTAQSFLQSFSLCSPVFNLQTATPGGKSIDFVGVDESSSRWIQEFSAKPYANPAKLESIDGARYQALLIPDCPGALSDLAHSGSLARILAHFTSQQKPVCAVGHGVSALCCATEGQRWIFSGYSLTGPSVFELVRETDFAKLPLIVEDFVKDSGGSYTASTEDAIHVVLDRHLVTGQNQQSTWAAVNNLIILFNGRK
ncbi:glutamine amidotransferase-like class 1 domain-containing protein 1 [Brienomyrus brachyistius]|uniref:glutamine amidotransferase-like class 1 domain-containing protein 1 n=1 Tax=Brienomyrus brachyistius TaxID=42636 RepID=UPI0020B235CB|nr:glutamine amidotransferase-like class 1 domain-containing protein 1 [Brienomyrus brachyistius]